MKIQEEFYILVGPQFSHLWKEDWLLRSLLTIMFFQPLYFSQMLKSTMSCVKSWPMRPKSQGRSQNTALDLSRPWAKSPLKVWPWPPGNPARHLFSLELTPSKWKQISKQGITECKNETRGGIAASVCSYYLLPPALFSFWAFSPFAYESGICKWRA